MKIFEFVSGLFTPVTKLIDELDTSEEERNEFKLKMKQIQESQMTKALDFQKELMTQQAASIQGEISGNWLQRSWRPILMLSFGFIIIYQFFIAHLIRFWAQDAWPDFEIPDQFWTLLEIGIGGYVAGRSIEKIVPKVMEGNAKKKEAEAQVQVLKEEVEKLQTEDLSAKEMRQLARIKKREQRFLRGKNRREKRRRERDGG